MKARATLLFLLLLILFSGCDLINPSEDIPSYIHIDSLSFDAGSSMGSSSHAISEVWVYDTGKMLGAYDLPADIPVLKQGSTDISFYAGVKNNGISGTRIRYPFYEDDSRIIELSSEKEITVNPSFTYKEIADIVFLSDFEDASTGFNSTNNNLNVEFLISNEEENVLEGNGSGHALFPDSDSFFQVTSSNDDLHLPAGHQIWLEMDYKCNNSFSVGLFAHLGIEKQKDLALIVNSSIDNNGIAEWKKIYIELTHVAKLNINADHFNLYIESVPDEGIAIPDLFFDNIKIIVFE